MSSYRSFERGQYVLFTLAVLTILGTLAAWASPGVGALPPALTWSLRFGLLTLAAGITLVACTRKPPPDAVPDFLFETHQRPPFDAGGLALIVNIGEFHGCAFFEVCFQNRFAHPCHTVLTLTPPKPLFRKPPLPPVRIVIDAEGGEYGAVGHPFGIPIPAQGKTYSFTINARTGYASGKGEQLLRYVHRKSLSAGSSSGLMTLFAILTITHGGIVHLLAGSGVKLKISLPSNVSESVPGILYAKKTSLWTPADSEGPLGSASSPP
ncbi:MAG: hypothetical protein NTW19_07565 [Planctomycetota bacterium]|nr:hypothetical protein [Planctomycetota bacterium]